MGLIANLFGRTKTRVIYGHGSSTSPVRFSKEAYEQETVRAIVDCIATHTAKAEAMHVIVDDQGRVKEIRRNSPYAKLLNMSPNPLMTGYDMKYKVVAQLETHTTALVNVKWNGMQPEMMIPIPYKQFDIYPVKGGGYAVQFTDEMGETRLLSLEDVIILRKFYNNSDVTGDGNQAIYNTLNMTKAADEGLMSALSVSNKVRGIVKHTLAQLDPDDVKRSAKQFADQYREAADNGGIVAIDAKQEYTPLTVQPWSANAVQMRDIRGNLLRYWRMSEAILTSDYTESQWQAFYESIIEPRLIQMGQAFTVGCFTPNERNHGNRIIFFTSTLMHTSIQTKTNILTASREIGLFTNNELREMYGYPPTEDGDVAQVSLNYVKSTNQDKYQTGEEEVTEGGQEQAP